MQARILCPTAEAPKSIKIRIDRFWKFGFWLWPWTSAVLKGSSFIGGLKLTIAKDTNCTLKKQAPWRFFSKLVGGMLRMRWCVQGRRQDRAGEAPVGGADSRCCSSSSLCKRSRRCASTPLRWQLALTKSHPIYRKHISSILHVCPPDAKPMLGEGFHSVFIMSKIVF